MVLVALYVGTNVWEEIGPLGVVRFVSPFYYANFSRALVPGYGADLGAMAVLLLMAVVLLAAATVAFVHARLRRSTLGPCRGRGSRHVAPCASSAGGCAPGGRRTWSSTDGACSPGPCREPPSRA